MSSLTIRNLDPSVKEKLRIRAAQHGHSMEAEARLILADAFSPARTGKTGTGLDLVNRIRARFAEVGGVELDLPTRQDPPRPLPTFD